jgi:formylglycine-generating enzyme required for sulfatase activity
VLRRVAVAVLTDFQNFEPEQRLIAGQLLGSRPGLDPRRGVGVVETQNFASPLNFASLPDIAWVKIAKVDENGQSEFIYQDEKQESPDDFWMAQYLITYAQFQTFIDAADGWPNPRWWEGLSVPDEQREKPFDQNFPFWNHPRERVSWYQAIAFCRWLTAQARQHPALLPAEARDNLDWRISLPTEWQWEKAARSHDGRRYPWGGDTYRPGYANINETRENAGPHNLQSTSAVGMYPQGATPEGLLDLSGNVWEWCLNEHANPDNAQEAGSERRVLRGGAWYDNPYYAAAVRRSRNYPLYWFDSYGFRVVWSASVPVTSEL